jgi:amino acid transporter
MNNLTSAPRAALVRGIGRWDLIAATINGVIGAGIFGLPSRVYSLIGSYSLLAFVACALVVALIVLCFAEVSSRYGETGGPYLYAREAFGPVVGFEVGWLAWVARLSAFAANCNLLLDYLSYFQPGANVGAWRIALIVAIVVLLTAINIRGVRNAAVMSNVFTIAKLIPIVLFIAVGIFFIDPARFSAGELPAYGPFSNAVLLLIYAFTGFEMAVIPSGEVRDPQRNLPFALLTAMVLVALLYLLIQAVCVGTMPDLGTSTRPIVEAGGRFMGTAGAAVITAGVVVSIAGNLNILVLAASRLPFAMAERGELPRLFAATHPRFHTPHAAILLTTAIILLLTLSGSFIYALTVSTIARLISYGATCAALPVLRRRRSAPAALFLVPGGVLIAAGALLLGAWLLSNATWPEARATAIAALLGLAIYFAYRITRRGAEAPKSETTGDADESATG